MKKNDIKRILSELDGLPLPSKERILAACPAAEPKKLRKSHFRRNAVLIAAVVVLLLVAAGCAAEVKEYNDAISFFDENALSTENLTRSDIKKVYRDIITEQFELEKTAVVIIDSYKGYVIGVTTPTSAELKDIWDGLKSPEQEKYSWYYLDNDIVVDDIPYSGEMMFRKAVNGGSVWETKIPLRDGYVQGYTLIGGEEYIAAYGTYSPMSGGSKQCGFVEIFREDNGESVLRKIFDGYRWFSISEILADGDDMVIFARAELERFVFIRMDLSGEILCQKETEIGNRGIWDVAELGDEYIVQLGGYQLQEAVFKVSRDGEIGEGVSYSSDDTAYFICDMMEYEGKLYLSAYAVPKNGRDIQTSHDEIIAVLENIWKERNDLQAVAEETSVGSSGISNYGIYMNTENLVSDLRANYTAVLLVCDSNDGLPEEFYSVSGSVCGKLSVDENGKMLWETEYISDAYYSPATSSFSIGGACLVYRHTFDKNGKPISSEKTGEVTSFRR